MPASVRETDFSTDLAWRSRAADSPKPTLACRTFPSPQPRGRSDGARPPQEALSYVDRDSACGLAYAHRLRFRDRRPLLWRVLFESLVTDARLQRVPPPPARPLARPPSSCLYLYLDPTLSLSLLLIAVVSPSAAAVHAAVHCRCYFC